MIFDIGPQYKHDDKFKAAARLHQSEFRANVLKVDYNEYGNRINDEDAKHLVNFYDKLNSREVLRARYLFYSKQRDADMLRSEHIPFNLIAPLDTDKALAADIVSEAFELDCAMVISVLVEYAPEPKNMYLNDGTAFDAYIHYINSKGRPSGIGIETKYTETEYAIGETEKQNVENPDSPYWKISKASGAFIDPTEPKLGSDPLRQIWRNHLLGLSILAQGQIADFTSITLFPNGNEHFHKVIPEYRSLLTDFQRKNVFGVTFEKFIKAIGGSPEFNEWKAYLAERYIVPPA